MKNFLIGLLSAILILSLAFGVYKVIGENDTKRSEVYASSKFTAPSIEITYEFERTNYLEELLDTYFEENNINRDSVGIYVENFETGEEYYFNEGKYFTAASVYKLSLAMVYYEKIADGEIKGSDSIQFLSSHLESGGFVESNYSLGSYIAIEDLLYYSIVYSDNSASRMLFGNLGGFTEFKSIAAKYSSDLDSTYYLRENTTNTAYMNDVLDYLYNSNDFDTLKEHMALAQPNAYFNLYLNETVYQKYGMYNTALNSAGISDEGRDYSIVVLTSLGSGGNKVLGEINEICYNYFNNK